MVGAADTRDGPALKARRPSIAAGPSEHNSPISADHIIPDMSDTPPLAPAILSGTPAVTASVVRTFLAIDAACPAANS